jgi:hypothetical protein
MFADFNDPETPPISANPEAAAAANTLKSTVQSRIHGEREKRRANWSPS